MNVNTVTAAQKAGSPNIVSVHTGIIISTTSLDDIVRVATRSTSHAADADSSTMPNFGFLMGEASGKARSVSGRLPPVAP
jgi:hypothetical protein